MKINITDEIRQEILDMLNRDTAKEYFEKLRDTEKNPTRGQVYAYRSWEQSTEDRADMFEVRALPWGSQIKDGVMKESVAALTAADIDEIIVTDQSTALMESVHALVAEGAYLEGVGTVTRDPLHDPSGRREVKGLVVRGGISTRSSAAIRAARRTVALALLRISALRRVTALLIAASVTVAFGIPKVNIVGYNLGGSALVAVVVLPVADLQPPLDDRHTSLAEIFADEFSGSSPGNDVDEIRFLFPRLAFEVAVAGDGEAGHRKTGLRTPQLWVAGQSTHDDDLIQHRP